MWDHTYKQCETNSSPVRKVTIKKITRIWIAPVNVELRKSLITKQGILGRFWRSTLPLRMSVTLIPFSATRWPHSGSPC